MPELFTYTLDCEKNYKPGICFFEGSKQMEDFEKYKSNGNAQFQAVDSVASLTTCDKRTVYEQQGGICPICKNHFEFSEMAGDHIVPWSKGGKSVLENLQMLCTDCNLKKSDN